MNVTLADYQLAAIAKLNESMASDKRDVVLKSCTGSGKTVILTHFMDRYCRSHENIVFVWLTPGKGNLEEQSKSKMDKHIHGAQTKLLHEVMTSGFDAGDFCFINWEKLTKKGNNALKDSERTNFIEHIEEAHNIGLSFVIVVDESHQNDTIKANEIIDCFKTNKIIRSSATPKGYTDAFIVDVPEEDVIAEGLIKKLLIINENFPQIIDVTDPVLYLLDRSIAKRQELHSVFIRHGSQVNPMIMIQMPNNSELLIDQIERYLETKGITYENNQLAVWLDKKNENTDGISKIDAEPIVLIFKQALATGWDCPRAHILVKLRDNMSEIFEIQTIGRIRRMPEQKHYENELLDCCYLYTFDEKFTEEVKRSLGNDALNAVKLYLKSEHRDFSLITENKTNIPYPRDAALALKVIAGYFETKYDVMCNGKYNENKTRLQVAKFEFSDAVVAYTQSGEISILSGSKKQIANLNEIEWRSKLYTHKHGRAYHHSAADIGLKVTLEYSTINTILQRLFCLSYASPYKILDLSVREFYAFVINNCERLKNEIVDAMSDDGSGVQLTLNKQITERPLAFPQKIVFTFDGTAKSQDIMDKNVYRGYLVSAEPRSAPEKLFEKFCASSERVVWIYKNGDKGSEYLSIVYTDNLGKQKSFYPDYVVGIEDGSIWIIETKGGFTKSGDSEDIDKYTSKKFGVLKAYVTKHAEKRNLKFGIVCQDKQSQELCICTENYNDDIKSDSWQLLKNLI